MFPFSHRLEIRSVHTRRVSSFLLGAWMAGCLFMAYAQVISPRVPNTIIHSQQEAARKLVGTLGAQNANLLLRHSFPKLIRTQPRHWEEIQIALGLLLGVCLARATQMRILPLILCG